MAPAIPRKTASSGCRVPFERKGKKMGQKDSEQNFPFSIFLPVIFSLPSSGDREFEDLKKTH